MRPATIDPTGSWRDYSRMDELAQMLVAARTAKGLTQRQVAERLTISAKDDPPEGAVISKYEKGVIAPGLDRMAELISVLDLDEARAWRAYLDVKLKDDLRDALAERPKAWAPGT